MARCGLETRARRQSDRHLHCRALLPAVACQAPFATIVNIASGQGLLPNTPNMTAYAASKRGVVNLTRALLTAIGFMLGPLIGHLFIGHTQ